VTERCTECEKENYYPIPKRRNPEDIHQKINEIKERSNAKQEKKG
jgi:rRNA maturation protein Nop10